MQSLQHPQQDAGTFLGQLFDQEGVIHPGRVTVFHRDEDLSAPEAVTVIVSGDVYKRQQPRGGKNPLRLTAFASSPEGGALFVLTGR